MCALPDRPIMLDMTRPATSSKLLLVADPRAAGGGGAPGAATADAATAPLRRYRLARLRLEGRATSPGLRFEHLKRTYD
jgi:hypothetical protein